MKEFFVAVCPRRILGACLILSLAGAGTTLAQIPTGNPSTDGGWTVGGNSSSLTIDGAANQVGYSATMYATAFTLAGGSTLIGNLGGFNWNAGDTVLGVGGVFTATGNSSLTYNGAGGSTSTRIVIKYGSSTPTWPAPPGTSASGTLLQGGVGAVLLGTASFTFSAANAGTLVVPSASPEMQTGNTSSAFMSISGDMGQVITAWNVTPTTTNMVAFESFLDLTLLDATYPSNNVALGNEFVLDLQQAQNGAQDSLGTLPVALPEPSTLVLVGTGLLGALSMRRRKA